MGSPYKNFKADPQMEQEGIWLQYDDYKILVARAGGSNINYLKSLERHSTPYKTAIKNEIISAEQMRKILIKTYADSVILGWDGIEDENGKKLTFNKDNAEKLLTDCPDLFDDIRQSATGLALFRRELLEKAAKNS